MVRRRISRSTDEIWPHDLHTPASSDPPTDTVVPPGRVVSVGVDTGSHTPARCLPGGPPGRIRHLAWCKRLCPRPGRAPVSLQECASSSCSGAFLCGIHRSTWRQGRGRQTCSSPNGTRTRVFGVRGRYPRPLDDGAIHTSHALGS